ncbi:YeeE/YedE family protein [Neomegalonema sp.]|uniref:YeeE/YedE family protein n=1 Tax=Neomegalonema sp. TaxID=2039713 RepID=UPI00260D78A2|nr:YeeE/YedE family protein [Neomegalonema sp.]MDD2868741.1 YeeE/YedE family protein [Neomegalonema sp.]
MASLAVLGLLAWSVRALGAAPGGRNLAFALGIGTILGIVLQRARFCFYCHARDHVEGGDPRGLLAILLAMAVGILGMLLVISGWLPDPQGGRLPPEAHIGPVSWALVAAGLAFGLGMVVSGSCISAHWYRLGEGSPTSPFALIGAAGGFLLGFNTWNPLYSATIAESRVLWLPQKLGYVGAILAQLALILLIAALIWRPRKEAPPPPARSLGEAARRLIEGRWPAWVGGLIVGAIAAVVILRLRPLGVTAALGSGARGLGDAWGWIPERLDGLDGFAGCVTVITEALWRTPNALLVAGIVGGAFAAALASGQFAPKLPTGTQVFRGLTGGLLLGWGAMTGLGCTIGNTLSGVMAGAVSGWVFTFAMVFAIWAGLRLGLGTGGRRRASA